VQDLRALSLDGVDAKEAANLLRGMEHGRRTIQRLSLKGIGPAAYPLLPADLDRLFTALTYVPLPLGPERVCALQYMCAI
jgi:hypothetical protein